MTLTGARFVAVGFAPQMTFLCGGTSIEETNMALGEQDTEDFEFVAIFPVEVLFQIT